MLKRECRIQKAGDFKKIFRLSRPVNEGRLVIRVARSNSLHSRFGFVISNKIDKRATRRNGLKRRLRAVAESLLPNIKAGSDILVIVRESYSFPYNFTEIESDLSSGLKKAGVLQ